MANVHLNMNFTFKHFYSVSEQCDSCFGDSPSASNTNNLTVKKCMYTCDCRSTINYEIKQI